MKQKQILSLLLLLCAALPMQAQSMKKLQNKAQFEERLAREAQTTQSIESDFYAREVSRRVQ